MQLEVYERQLLRIRFDRKDLSRVDNVVGEVIGIRVLGIDVQPRDCASKDAASEGGQRA